MFCCDTCEFTRISLEGIACGGTAGISAVMPLFGWPQFTAAIFIIGIVYFIELNKKLSKKRKK